MSEHTMDQAAIAQYIETMPDEVAMYMMAASPWQSPMAGGVDVDGFPVGPSKNKSLVPSTLKDLQQECWNKFNTNPHVRTAVLDTVGRIAGKGFNVVSATKEIQAVLTEISDDPRNKLHTSWPKYVGRAEVEGELFLVLTVHNDGFIEVDFRDPADLSGTSAEEGGIMVHPTKANFPLFYTFTTKRADGSSVSEQIPSINIARYPDLLAIAKKLPGYDESLQKDHKTSNRLFRTVKGYRRFVVSWDMGFMTVRNLSHLRTTIAWTNHYEQLKMYEIDHKKSSGAYLWVVTCEDPKLWKTWLTMTAEQKAQTGLMAKKMPGGQLILPPGFKMTCVNPQLPKISEEDTDILHMVTSGLNAPEDMVTGQSKGTYASVKASRGPMSDRISDKQAFFERFLRYEFWSSIFFLKTKLFQFPPTFKKREAVSFEGKKPKYEEVERKPHELIEIVLPVTEMADLAAVTAATMGVKHGSWNASLGIPNKVIAERLGMGDYHHLRLQAATEEEMYPELQPEIDQDAATQEGAQEDMVGAGEKKKNPSKPEKKAKKV